MHTCEPPIVHGNLSCDTIFIQHNGLIKIGCIAPDIVNTHVKTCVGHDLKFSRNLHFIAPEMAQIVDESTTTTTFGNQQLSTTQSSTSTSASSSTSTTTTTTMTTSSNSALTLPTSQQSPPINNTIYINKQSQMNNTAVDIYSFGMVALEVILTA